MEDKKRLIGPLHPAPQQDSSLIRYANLSSSLVSASSFHQLLSISLFLHHSFPPDLLVFGDQRFKCFTFEPSKPHCFHSCTQAHSLKPCRMENLALVLLMKTIRFGNCDYSQVLYSRLDVQFLTTNLAFRKPN